MLAGTDPEEWDRLCVVSKRPESLKELAANADARAMARLAPLGSYRDGAALAASRSAAAISTRAVPAARGRAEVYGRGPLRVDGEGYNEVNGLGLDDNMGRIDSYVWDSRHDRLFAAVGNGGIWRSDDQAGHWRSAQRRPPHHGHRSRRLDAGPRAAPCWL